MRYAVWPYRDGEYQEAIHEDDELFEAIRWAFGNLVYTPWRIEDTETGRFVWQSGLPE